MPSKINLTNYLTISILLLATFCTAVLGNPIYVDYNATGANNGSSWIDAYNFLQNALALANSAEKPVEIWVAQGTYKTDQGANQTPGDREVTFWLINDVSIYGGFPSGGAEFAQRDPNLYDTTLSGDLEGNDVSVSDPCDLPNEQSRAENSYHVVSCSLNNETAILDGFTITGGNADSEYPDNYGGGMYNNRSSPTLANCTFSNNSGGGMYNCNDSSPMLTHCTFSGNSAVFGGGMYNYKSNPILTNCTFGSNSAKEGGGGMGNYDSSPILANCPFNNNSARHLGGGMENYQSSPTLTNCTFSDNSSKNHGGGMDNYKSSPTMIHCNFSGNSADDGGGMYNSSGSFPILSNCTFSENSANFGGGIINWLSSPILTNCTFSGNSAEYGGGMENHESSPTLTNCTFSGNSAKRSGGMFNYQSSPTLTNCTFSRNFAKESGGGMRNSESSPILTNCTFSGNSAVNGGGMHNRYDSSPTLTNCIFSGNSALGQTGAGGGTYDLWCSTTYTNCTFNGNTAMFGPGIYVDEAHIKSTNCIFWDGEDGIFDYDGFISITHSDVQGSCPGQGNMAVDPCFANPGYWADVNDPNTAVEPNESNAVWVDGDYHLKSEAGRWEPASQSWVQDDVTSPCIDAGNPTSPIGHEPFPNGGIVNMGAYGGTAEASKSYFGEPICETIVAGDINGDCKVDFSDFAIMASHWLEDNNP